MTDAERIALLEAQVVQLKAVISEMAGTYPPVCDWDFLDCDPKQKRVLSALHAVSPSFLTFRALSMKIFGSEPKPGLIGDKLGMVHISKLRKALAPHGVEIITKRRFGYRLDEANRDRIDALRAAYRKSRSAA